MAYGAIRSGPQPSQPQVARIYPASPRALSEARAAIVTVPFDFAAGDALDEELEKKLATEFNMYVRIPNEANRPPADNCISLDRVYVTSRLNEIDEGNTYPQEQPLSISEFKAYFLSNRLVLGIWVSASQLLNLQLPTRNEDTGLPLAGVALRNEQLAHVSLGRCRSLLLSTTSSTDPVDWGRIAAFTYYIKPNYPGRSSHLCNAGFVVPVAMRGMGLGGVAGRSFLFYGPRAGYRGSVFNLVYSSNAASVRIWQNLGFTVIGIIPEAGRLKTRDGGEEYIDAQVVHGDFRTIGHHEVE